MNLFISDVNKAINDIMLTKSFMIVFISNSLSSSHNFKNVLENHRIIRYLRNMTCLKIIENSEEHEYFNEIFKISRIPAICIIDYQGEIVDCFSGTVDADELELRLKSIIFIEENVPVSTNPIIQRKPQEIAPSKIKISGNGKGKEPVMPSNIPDELPYLKPVRVDETYNGENLYKNYNKDKNFPNWFFEKLRMQTNTSNKLKLVVALFFLVLILFVFAFY